MTLIEACSTALKGDPLGVEISRKIWLPGIRVEVSENSYSMLEIKDGEYTGQNFCPSLADIMAEDWQVLGSPYGVKP